MAENRSRPTKVNPETFAAALKLAGLTIAAGAREIGMSKQSLHSMVVGRWPVSARVVRDLPLSIAARVDGLDPEAVRDAIFSGEPIDHEGGSFLTSRIHQ